MSTKWAGAIALLIAVAIGAWAGSAYLGGEAPSSGTGEEAAPEAATISLESTNRAFAGSIPQYTGIENIYIVNSVHASGWDQNFTAPHENVENIITENNDNADIPYDDAFYIVVAVKGSKSQEPGDENLAFVDMENMYVVHKWKSGDLGSSYSENSDNTGKKYQFDSGSTPVDWIRVNHVFDNDGNGFVLHADESAGLRVDYWTYS